MKQRRGWAITVGILLCLLTGGNAFGADLSLAVPVNVSNLPPQVGSVWVNCYFYYDVGEKNSVTFAKEWAAVSPLVNGAANKTVTFGVNIPDSVKINVTINKYRYFCLLGLSGDATHNSWYMINGPDAPPWAASKPGTTPIDRVSGNFP